MPATSPHTTHRRSVLRTDLHVGERIRAARETAGWSADRLGEAVGKSRSSVYGYEGDENGAPTEVMRRIADALGRPLAWFYDMERGVGDGAVSASGSPELGVSVAAQPYHWTVDQYERMIGAGIFPPGTRAQLIDGTVYEMSPQGSRHSTAIRMVEEALRSVFSEGCDVRSQAPLKLPDASEPEPDVSVVPGHFRDYADEHPREALLAVEVSDATLRFDQRKKTAVYAQAGIAEYWIVNLVEGVLEVYREPAGETYRQKRTLTPDESVSPLACPDARITVADLLP